MDQSGLDNIVLDGALCSQLYKTGLTNLDFTAKETVAEVHFSGQNKQQVLVAVDVHGALKAEDESLLKNLLKACQLTMDDIALVNVQEQETSVEDILRQLSIKKALFFGIPAGTANLPIGNTEDKVIIYDQKYFVKTLPLSALQHNESRKRALWGALKQMFDL